MNDLTTTEIEQLAREVALKVAPLAAEDVARILRCAVTTVNDRARTGDLPGLKFGDGGWVFPAGALAARLEELATTQALQRRQQARHPQAPTAVLQAVPPPKRRRVLPVLPVLPEV